jgi:RNA polymerase sigma-70 factor (ECF subfamily)
MFGEALSLGGMARSVQRPTDELALCRRIASGERHLFAQIVDRYRPLVAGAVAAQGVDSADVEDLAQVAFINAYRGLGGFRGEAKLSSWLYRIALNVARAHLQRQAQRGQRRSVEEELETGRLPVDEQSSQAVAASVRNRMLGEALRQLPEHQRACLSLYYFEELSYEEIAAALRLNLNTVRTHIRRGKLGLAKLLDETMLA